MDVELAVIGHLRSRFPDVSVSADVPGERPARLITVERTGGRAADVLDHPELAVQSWAPTRMEASALARDVDAAMADLPYETDCVMGVSRTSLSNWPDPDSRSPRYQGVYELTTSL